MQARLRDAAIVRGMDISAIGDLGGFRDKNGELLPDKISMFGMTESFSAHSAEPLDERFASRKGRVIWTRHQRL